jgi:putative heme-binding domain-containing protein
MPPRLEDSLLLDRLIEIGEAVARRKEQAEQPATEQQLARTQAQRQKRDQPSEADLAEARKQVAEIHAKAVKQRAEERAKLTSELLSSSLKAVMLAEAVRNKRLSAETREMVITAALAASTDPAVRDLFESFVPENRRTKRLGETIDRAEILKLAGDTERGRQLFHESTVVQCRNCHRIGGKGTELGPDLDGIGKKYDRSRLLESILQPSLQIDPKYKAWLIETKSGQVMTGLIIRRDTKEIELRDAQNKLHRIPADTVEEVFPQTKSLMPELLVRDFTAQQLVDLLEYLGSLKTTP